MGAEHRARALTAGALIVSVFAPTVAFAKTLQGTGGGSAPVDGVVAGPSIAGTPPPVLIPPSLVPMIVPPPQPLREPLPDPAATAGADNEPAPETIAAGEAESSGPNGSAPPTSVPRTASGDTVGPDSTPGGATPARSAQTPNSSQTPNPAPAGPVLRVAGPALPRHLLPSSAPTALALRAGPDASPVAPTTTITSESSEVDTRLVPTTGGSSTVASSAVVVIPDGVGYANCTSLPRPGASNALLDWTTSRTAEITDGRDLRTHAWISATAGGLLPPSAGGPFAAYLLEPNSLAVLAAFRQLEDGGRASDRPTRSIPDLHIADCDGGPAVGISPGSYLLRYSITGTPDPSAPDQNDTFLSPPFPVRVLAGPTAPTPTSAGPNVSQS